MRGKFVVCMFDCMCVCAIDYIYSAEEEQKKKQKKNSKQI